MAKAKRNLDDANACLNEMKKYHRLSEEVMKLISEDLVDGIDENIIRDFYTRSVSFDRIKFVSMAAHQGAPRDVLDAIVSKKSEETKIEKAYEYVKQGVPLALFEEGVKKKEPCSGILTLMKERLEEIKERHEVDDVESGKNIKEEKSVEQATLIRSDLADKVEKESKEVDSQKEKGDSAEKVTVNEEVSEKKEAPSQPEEVSEIVQQENIVPTAQQVEVEHPVPPVQPTAPAQPGLTAQDLQAVLNSVLQGTLSTFRKEMEAEREEARKADEKRWNDVTAELKALKESQMATNTKVVKESEVVKKASAFTDVSKNTEEVNQTPVSEEPVVHSKYHPTIPAYYGTFTRDGRSTEVKAPVEIQKKKSSGFGAFAELMFKKKSAKSIVKLVVAGELTREQMMEIKYGMQSMLTEDQLCDLINSKVTADKMHEIVEIAKMENEYGYTN